MIHLYGAWYLFVFLRPNIKVKILTQSAEKWICMRTWAWESGAILFFKDEKAPDDWSFSPSADAAKQENSLRDGNGYCLIIFDFSENDYNLAENNKFCQSQIVIAPPMLVRWW